MPAIMISDADATLADLTHERVVPLRDWLNGCWAAVLSHPDDFAPPAATPPGFVTCIADGVLAAGIKPIAFQRSLDRSSWLDHAFDDDALIVLQRESGPVVDLAEHALANRLGSLGVQRFVVIVDDSGRIRMTLTYQAGERSRTMIDIVETITVLRGEPSAPPARTRTGTQSAWASVNRSTSSYRDSFSS